jgi:hypothetical protein
LAQVEVLAQGKSWLRRNLGSSEILRWQRGRGFCWLNFGVEIGQVVIVLTAAPLIAALNIYARPRLTQGLLTAAACAVVLAGSYWFWQRVLAHDR